MGSGEPSITFTISSSPSRASRATTHVPSGSIPRRPARPAICVSSLCESARKPRSVRLVRPWSTTDRAGMWMPSDIVSVAKTTLQRPRSKSTSMSRLRLRRGGGGREPNPQPERLEHALVQRRFGDGGALADQVADRRVDLALLRSPEQALALGEDVLHRTLATGAAEDEGERRQPAPGLERLDEDGRMDDTPRVPAPAVVGAAGLVSDHPRAPAADRPHLAD